MSVVIDASVMGPMLIADEQHDRSDELRSLLIAGDAIVPQHWPLEIANLCRSALKRGRLTREDSAARLEDIRRLAVPIDDQTISRLWVETMALAFEHDLTPYDAAYLELAARRKLPLFSYDRELIAASVVAGVKLF